MGSMPPRVIGVEQAVLAAILVAGALLRAWLVLGPYAEIDADEAVVGLMALNVPGELPVFYWEQHYLGTVEAYVAALLFGIFGPSSAALKAVPAAFSLAFIGLVYAAARPVFGAAPALASALYLALPPSFFAAWSVKARGGYAEAIAFGMLFLVAAGRLADDPRGPSPRWAVAAGLAAGLGLWTHPMSGVMIVAGALYVLLAWRRRAERDSWRPLAVPVCFVVAGVIVGAAPAIAYNLANGFPSVRFAAEGGTEPRAALVNLWGLVRYGLPVIVGLAEATPSRELLLIDWPTRPGSSWLVTALLPTLGLGLVWAYRGSLVAFINPTPSDRDATARARGPALFVFVLLLVPPFVAVSRFANLWAEPRYALPIYAAVPLATGLIWRLAGRSRVGAGLGVAALLGLNVFSLLASDYRLSLPTSAGPSTAADRAELIAYLRSHGVDRIYTDYWLAYPIAFESREQIVPAVWSGGFSRRASYAHLVFIAPAPAFLFARDTPGDAEFRRRLAAVGGSADVADVGFYRVYTGVRPLDAMRVP